MPHITLCRYTIAELTTGVLSHCSLHHHGTVLGTVAGVMVMGLSHRCLYLVSLASSSSVCLQDLHVISLILLLRIRLTRRGGICWSEPRGIPRPAYDDGGCASLSLEASQDWHKVLESMSDEEYVPNKVNLGPQGDNSAWEGIIRPGPGNPSLARPEQCSDGGPAGINESGLRRKLGLGQCRPGERPRPAGGIPA
jgi:hypothetical protein